MNYGGDAADQIVRYSMEGMEHTLRISGSIAKNLAVLIVAVMKDQKKTRGKTNLLRMLKEQRAMKFFTIPHDRLREFFAERFLEDAVKLPEVYGTGTENDKIWKMAEESGASARYRMGEGGFLAALWKMAEASGVGLSADLRSVPIRQETIEICEIFDVNPYKLLSGGSILLGIQGGDAFVQELRREGIMAAVIGQTNSGNDRLLYSGGNARYLERPAEDEIKKLGFLIS